MKRLAYVVVGIMGLLAGSGAGYAWRKFRSEEAADDRIPHALLNTPVE